MSSLRLTAVRALMSIIDGEVQAGVTRPDRVQVIDHDPGGVLQAEAIYVVDVSGTPAPDDLAGGIDQPTEDNFTVTVVCRAGLAGATGHDQLDRVDAFYMAVRGAVLGVSHGSDLDGLDRISSTALGTVDGPLAGPDDQGVLGLCRVQIQIQTDEVTP